LIAASTIFDHPWIIFVALAIVLLRWLSQKAQSGKDVSQPPKTPAQPIPRSDTESEEVRIRRFLEALGQPPGAKPPSAVARRSSPHEAVSHLPPPIRSPLPPLTTVPAPLPLGMESSAEPPPIPPRVEPRKFTPAIASDTLFEIRGAGGVDDPALPSRRADVSLADQSGLLARLATKQALRDAIVLREILGPPRSLQPLETIGGISAAALASDKRKRK
jgi:hypothetical protein